EPEVGLEAPPQRLRLRPEPLRERPIAPDLLGQPRAAALRVEDVALDLAARDRRLGEVAVCEQDRVPRVLPALVAKAALAVSPLVLDVPVAVAVAVAVDPREGGAGMGLELSHQLAIAGPALGLVEQDQEQRRRIGAAEVR